MDILSSILSRPPRNNGPLIKPSSKRPCLSPSSRHRDGQMSSFSSSSSLTEWRFVPFRGGETKEAKEKRLRHEERVQEIEERETRKRHAEEEKKRRADLAGRLLAMNRAGQSVTAKQLKQTLEAFGPPQAKRVESTSRLQSAMSRGGGNSAGPGAGSREVKRTTAEYTMDNNSGRMGDGSRVVSRRGKKGKSYLYIDHGVAKKGSSSSMTTVKKPESENNRGAKEMLPRMICGVPQPSKRKVEEIIPVKQVPRKSAERKRPKVRLARVVENEEWDKDDLDFIDDGPLEEDDMSWREELRSATGYDPTLFKNDPLLECGVATADMEMREERFSTKVGAKEDEVQRKLIQMEEAREAARHRKRRKGGN